MALLLSISERGMPMENKVKFLVTLNFPVDEYSDINIPAAMDSSVFDIVQAACRLAKRDVRDITSFVIVGVNLTK